VIYCGVLKELCGMQREEVYLATGDTVGTMLRVLRERMAPESKVWDSLAVAVNDAYAGLRTVLEDDDEVALLPPVSGGLV
jgi:molybdopterin converting factor small subunit